MARIRYCVLPTLVAVAALFVVFLVMVTWRHKREGFDASDTLNLQITIEGTARAAEDQHRPLRLRVNRQIDDSGIPIRVTDRVYLSYPAEPLLSGQYHVVNLDQTDAYLSEAVEIAPGQVTELSLDRQALQGKPRTSFGGLLQPGDQVFFDDAFFTVTLVEGSERFVARLKADVKHPVYACQGDPMAADREACLYGCNTWAQSCLSNSHCPAGMSCVDNQCAKRTED